MGNELLPEDVTITIDGNDLTTKIFNFEETGGERNRNNIRTMRRNHKKGLSSPTDWNVSFNTTVTDTDFFDQYETVGSFDISISWSGSLTITYNEAQSLTSNVSMSADDRLISTNNFVVPYYDENGSSNRVIS